MSRLARVRETERPRGVVKEDDLTRRIKEAQHDCRTARTHAIGKMLNLFLGTDDQATYAHDRDVRERLESLTKIRGLQLEWTNATAPHICWTRDRESLVFPFGCPKPPRIPDPRQNSIFTRPGEGGGNKMIEQKIVDHASGYIEGVGGESFVVLQPVLYLGVWIMDGLYNLMAHPDPVSGKYPALLMHPRNDRTEALIVFGRFELCSARPGGGGDMPWEGRAA
jgi:hypothetical protein